MVRTRVETPGPSRSGDLGEQVAVVVNTARLARGAGQHRDDRVVQPRVAVGGDVLDAGQAAGGQAARERQPPPVLGPPPVLRQSEGLSSVTVAPDRHWVLPLRYPPASPASNRGPIRISPH